MVLKTFLSWIHTILLQQLCYGKLGHRNKKCKWSKCHVLWYCKDWVKKSVVIVQAGTLFCILLKYSNFHCKSQVVKLNKSLKIYVLPQTSNASVLKKWVLIHLCLAIKKCVLDMAIKERIFQNNRMTYCIMQCFSIINTSIFVFLRPLKHSCNL